uniref:ATP synthase complex subunit 8 n=1 Tax=Coenobita brevimanus TaxID=1547439 RepID=A0A3Q8AYN4_9EUCA|nr:ATP synthase F0 subunit 8 [Coenobita brevimanus]ASS30602.1 ATP synthase F0 subunit 8 [Coenobita brevimanus]QNA48312.1 ATP synthase protein 8 [Coenobita brevimanus]QUL61627.1 ATP synthase F0 subunit 8 [Coenobita brevimanus]
MPQMAPILWLNLVIMFLITFIVFIVMNYYISVPKKIESSSAEIGIVEKIWKW